MTSATGIAKTRAASAPPSRGRRWARKALIGAVSLGLGWLLWQILYWSTGGAGLVFAGPAATFETLGRLVRDGVLWRDMWVTTQEFALGAVLAAVLGVIIGLVVGYFRPIGVVLRPWLAAGYATPLIALTPLFVVWFGIGMWSKIAIGFIVMIFPLIINTALGVSTADRQLIEMMYSLGANQRQIITKIVLRGSIPHITTGLRLGVGRGFTAVVAAELMGSNAGMGYRILTASETFDITVILAYVVVLAVIGAVLIVGLERLDEWIAERRA